MKADAVIVSAGQEPLLHGGEEKAISLPGGGKPILAHSLDKFGFCPLIPSILLVVAEEDMDYCLRKIVGR